MQAWHNLSEFQRESTFFYSTPKWWIFFRELKIEDALYSRALINEVTEPVPWSRDYYHQWQLNSVERDARHFCRGKDLLGSYDRSEIEGF